MWNDKLEIVEINDPILSKVFLQNRETIYYEDLVGLDIDTPVTKKQKTENKIPIKHTPTTKLPKSKPKSKAKITSVESIPPKSKIKLQASAKITSVESIPPKSKQKPPAKSTKCAKVFSVAPAATSVLYNLETERAVAGAAETQQIENTKTLPTLPTFNVIPPDFKALNTEVTAVRAEVKQMADNLSKLQMQISVEFQKLSEKITSEFENIKATLADKRSSLPSFDFCTESFREFWGDGTPTAISSSTTTAASQSTITSPAHTVKTSINSPYSHSYQHNPPPSPSYYLNSYTSNNEDNTSKNVSDIGITVISSNSCASNKSNTSTLGTQQNQPPSTASNTSSHTYIPGTQQNQPPSAASNTSSHTYIPGTQENQPPSAASNNSSQTYFPGTQQNPPPSAASNSSHTYFPGTQQNPPPSTTVYSLPFNFSRQPLAQMQTNTTDDLSNVWHSTWKFMRSRHGTRKGFAWEVLQVLFKDPQELKGRNCQGKTNMKSLPGQPKKF